MSAELAFSPAWVRAASSVWRLRPAMAHLTSEGRVLRAKYSTVWRPVKPLAP
jgi:hypothetical protein